MLQLENNYTETEQHLKVIDSSQDSPTVITELSFRSARVVNWWVGQGQLLDLPQWRGTVIAGGFLYDTLWPQSPPPANNIQTWVNLAVSTTDLNQPPNFIITSSLISFTGVLLTLWTENDVEKLHRRLRKVANQVRKLCENVNTST